MGITRVEARTLLKSVEKRAPEVAPNLRNHVWGIVEYAIDGVPISAYPVSSIRVFQKRDRVNHPALPPDQTGGLLRKLDDRSLLNEHFRIALLLVILTACREAEIIKGKRAEVNVKSEAWEIAAERMKNGRPHWIPSPHKLRATAGTARADTCGWGGVLVT